MCTVIFRVIVFVLFGVAGTNGADCPELEFNPPRVVVRYGGSVSVNCSTSTTGHEGMGWEATRGGTGLVEDVSYLIWTYKNIDNWNIEPRCFLNKEDGGQCREILPLVIYKPPDSVSISLDHTGPMVEGTEYQLSCDVLNVAPLQYLTVTWYKGNKTINTTSSDDRIKTPVKTSSILTITPSRHDDRAQYRCEAQLDLRPEGPQPHPTMTSEPLNITVHYGPDIRCSKSPFMEGESLEERCAVEGNPAPVVRWQNRAGQPFDPSTPLTRRDSGLYRVEAEGHSVVSDDVDVRVHYGPEIHCPEMYTGAERSTPNLTCVAGYPDPEIRWFRNTELVVFPERLNRSDAGQYVMVAHNNISTANHTLDIDVQYPPSEILELEDTEGDAGSTLELRCSSSGNPQPSYRWSYYLASNTAVESKDGAGLLTIREAGGINIGSYGCSAQNELGSVSKTARVAVRGAAAECPITISPARVLVEYGRPVSATCNATGSPSSVESLYWSPDSSSQNAAWQTDSLLDFNSSPRCIGNFTGIGECSKTLDITLYKNPDSVSISLDHTGPMVEGTEYRLSCDVLNVAPVQYLTVTWYKGNETVNTTSSDDPIKTPVKTSSILTITPSRHDDGAQYSCEAQLDLGPEGPQPPPTVTSEPLNITVHYKPHINATKLPPRIPVLRGYPEDLVCEAEGYPTPRIKWEYSVGMKAGGNLTVREAGHYNCTATNVVGTTFIVVEVVLKEDYLPLIAGFVAIAVGVISAVFVFIFFIYYKNTRMGHYSLKNAKLTNSLNGNVAQNGRETPLPMMKVC